jgi:hypothetical protein
VSTRIQSLASSLNSIIEPDFGLLDELLSAGVLSRREVAAVKNSNGVFEQNDVLLQLLSTKDDDKCQLFLNCLNSCYQEHIMNFILANGGL